MTLKEFAEMFLRLNMDEGLSPDGLRHMIEFAKKALGEDLIKRFVDNGDGTVTDTKTGLIWLKDANYLGMAMNWEEAERACKLLAVVAGKVWRLPEVGELFSLLDFSQYSPALAKGHPFENVQSSVYWSATTRAYNVSYAWVVHMSNGYVDSDYKVRYGSCVWPVCEL